MDNAFDVPDSTDWLNTPLKDLAALENALHCQICKEFYDTPMITSCNHTFCSKCIRTSLSSDGKCPACRTIDQASKLRNNWAMQEVVSTFLTARPATLGVARRAQEEAEAPTRSSKRKRKTVMDSDDVVEAEASGRTTRSKSRRIAASQSSQSDVIEIGDSQDEDELAKPESPTNDGLLECPLGCGKRMKEEQVFGHLDKCEDEQKEARKATSRTPGMNTATSRSSSHQNTRSQDRINEMNYSMMKETAMSKKLKELGIPNSGSKQLMINRHKEWVNIWNANCDSNQPRLRRDLLRDLDVWERTQGGKAPNASGISSTIMRKDFDGNAYSRRHQDEFSRLIADAKRKKNNIEITAPRPKDSDTAGKSLRSATVNAEAEKSPHFADCTADSEPSVLPPLKQDISSIIKPYENNEKAINSIREKVDAVNRGEETGAIWNEGFKDSATDSQADSVRPSELVANGLSDASNKGRRETKDDPGSMNDSATASSELKQPTQISPAMSIPFSTDSSDGTAPRPKSGDEHIVHGQTGSTCDIASHLELETSNLLKRVPMFEVPSQPISDIDGALEES